MKKLSIAALLSLVISSASMPTSAAHHESDSTFKYVEVNRIGNPAEVLEVKEGVSRALKKGEVRIEILAAPIHPSNLLQIAGNYLSDPELPSIPGGEGVGRVLEKSPEAAHLSEGQLVLLAGMGTWSEEIIAPASRVIPLPDLGMLDAAVIEQLSMATINPLAALIMLTSYAELKEGDWIVQSASNSAVGGYVIQLAKQRGFKTVNVVRREGLAEDLKSKGADVVLIDGPELAEKIASATNNERVVLAIDAVGGQTFSRLTESLGESGTLVSYGVLSRKEPMLNPGIVISKDLRIRGFWLSKWFKTAAVAEQQAAIGQIIPLVISGALRADVDSRFSVNEIKKAVTRAVERGRNGKVLIVPNK